MNRRDFLRTAPGAALTLPQLAVQRTRPNIIVILADDMGFSDLGCYGAETSTPHLDGLAKKGVRFTHFYNCARCCPTRSSLLTGLYPHQTGVGHMVSDLGKAAYRGDLNRRCVTIAEVLRPAGYGAAISGKWHVTPVGVAKHNWPLQRGFTRFYGTIHGGGSFYDPVTLVRGNEPIQVTDRNYYYTDAITDNALRFMDDFQRSGQPYFLYVAYTAPHYPLHALAGDIARCRGRYNTGWEATRLARHRRMKQLGIVDSRATLPPREDSLPPWAEQPISWKDAPHKEWQARRMEVYAAMVENMDRNIGRILGELRRQGAEQNTLILFLSDNGGEAQELRGLLAGGRPPLHVPETTLDGRPVQLGNNPDFMPGGPETFQSVGANWAYASNTPFRLYKRWAHEGGIATPLIASWPGMVKQPGSFVHEPGHVIDIMATCLDAAGEKYPETHQGERITPLEGRSLLPLVAGRRREPHEALFFEHEGNRAVRQGKWKLVSKWPDRWELFDLEADRTETNELSQKHPDRVAKMAARYDRWAEKVGATTPDALPRRAGSHA